MSKSAGTYLWEMVSVSFTETDCKQNSPYADEGERYSQDEHEQNHCEVVPYLQVNITIRGKSEENLVG